jgi:cytochrome P450
MDTEVDLFTNAMVGAELHEFFDWARGREHLVRVPWFDGEAYLVTDYDEVKHIFTDDVQFPGEALYQQQLQPLIGDTFVSMELDRHNVYRRLTTPAFKSRAVSHFMDERLVPLANEIVDGFYARGSADLVAELARPLPTYAICGKLGLPLDQEMRLRELAFALFGGRDEHLTPTEAAREIDELVVPILAQRRRAPGEDVLSQLALAERDGLRLTDQEIVNHVKLLFAAGAGNTSDSIALMLWALLTRPGAKDAVADPSARSGFVHETLRYEPVLSVLPRPAGRDAVVGGVDIPQGAWVLAGIAAANRDPNRFEDPHRFDSCRPQSEVLTFGFGPKFCTGAHLARSEVRVALDVIVERLSGLQLVHADEPAGGLFRSCGSVVARWDVSRP